MTTIALSAPENQAEPGALPNSPIQASGPKDVQAALRARLRALSDTLRVQEEVLPRRRMKIVATPEDETALRERLTMYGSIAKANLKDGFLQMPACVLHAPELSWTAKAVYQHLLTYFRTASDIYCWPSQETIAAALHICVRTVIRALAELEGRGYVEKWRRGQGQVNRYFINPLEYAQSFGHSLEESWKLMCQFVTSGTDKNAGAEVQKSQGKYNEDTENTSDVIHGFSRSGFAAGLGDEGVAGAAIRNESRKPARSESNERGPQPPTGSNPKTPPRQETGRENAKGAEKDTNKCKRRKHAPGEMPPPLPTYIAGQLAPISAFYGDTSRKSSKTSVAWYYADAHQRGMDEYDFVDFFSEAKEAVTAHGNTIRNFMSYFLKCLEGCVDRWCAAYDKAQARSQAEGLPAPVADEAEAEQPPAEPVSAPAGADTQEPVVESLAEEEHAAGVVSQAEQVEAPAPAGAESQFMSIAAEIRAEVEEVSAEAEAEECRDEQMTGVAPAGAEEQNQVEAAAALTEEIPGEQIVGATAEENQAAPAEEYPDLEIDFAPIQTNDPTHGADYRSVAYWGILLVKHFGSGRYQSFVVPTLLADRYGIVLVDKATGQDRVYCTYTEIGKKIYPAKKRGWR